jgi:hypothetical protein
MLNIGCLSSTCQVCQMTKNERTRKKYGLLPHKIAESDTLSLCHGLCVSDGSIYNKDTSQNTLSPCTHNNRSRNTPLVGLKLLKPQISHNPQVNAIIERVEVHKVINNMLRSFDLENNHENLKEQEDNPFDYFLQSTAWLLGY